MKIGRLNATAPIADKGGNATGIFQTYWDRVCKIAEGLVPASGYAPMTGTADDTTARDTATVTLEQLARRVKAQEDRLAALVERLGS